MFWIFIRSSDFGQGAFSVDVEHQKKYGVIINEIVSKYGIQIWGVSSKKKQPEKLINQISLLINTNARLVQKVASGLGGGGEE